MSISYFTLFEILVFTIALITQGNITHFTWWAVCSLICSDVAELANVASPRGEIMAATISVLVSVTVPIMSQLSCSLFSDTLTEVGYVVYVFGNSALHYWPSIRLTGRVLNDKRSTSICADASRVVAIYMLLNKPLVVYGCNNLQHYMVALAGPTAALIIEIIITRLV
tara:strand:- start:2667 stop:3170 length:504 start_codon:yes stop_codon:yes gene_type:complete